MMWQEWEDFNKSTVDMVTDWLMTGVTDDADRSIVLTLLQVAFLGKCDDWGLGPQGWPFYCLPDLVADCCESGDYILSTCLDQFCWDVVNYSWLPFLQWLYCSLHFLAKDGVVILCICLGTVQYWQISIGLVIVQLRLQSSILSIGSVFLLLLWDFF